MALTIKRAEPVPVEVPPATEIALEGPISHRGFLVQPRLGGGLYFRYSKNGNKTSGDASGFAISLSAAGTAEFIEALKDLAGINKENHDG